MKDALVLRYFCDPSVLLADHALSEQQHGNTDFCTEVTLEYFQSIKEKMICVTGRSRKLRQRIRGSNQILRKTRKTATHVDCATKLSAVTLT